MDLIKNNSDKDRALDILVHAFYNVPGIMWMIKSTSNRKELLRMFLSFCFQETSAKQGAYLTSDKNGVVFFYNLQRRSVSVTNFFRKLYLAFRVIGIRRSMQVIKTRRMIEGRRPEKGWYGWFLATEKTANGTRAGHEMRREMYRMADETNEPIYVETTTERTMVLYTKIGFYEYARIKHPYQDINIWFMRRDPHTFK